MKRTTSAVLVILGCLVVLVWLAARSLAGEEHGDLPSPSEPKARDVAAKTTSAQAKPATKLERIKAARIARLSRIAPLGLEPTDAASDAEPIDAKPPSDRCGDQCWGTIGMQVVLAGVVSGCDEELPPELRGEAKFRAHVLAEPGLGAVIESVEVLEDSIEAEAFIECILGSAPMAELADPDAPVSDDFVFRYSAGPSKDPASEFIAAHPELAEGHPELAAFLSRDPEQPSSNEESTAFAEWITQDDEARDAFMTWVTERGIDLSNVRVD